MTKLGKLIEKDIKRFAAEEFPKEACGILTKVGRKVIAIKCTNVSDAPEERFVISSDEYRGLIDSTGVYAIWHTHVNDKYPLTPSETDVAACNATGVDWIIVDVKSPEQNSKKHIFGEFFFIAPKGSDQEYLLRPYIYGVNDCFTLARDYYKNELGISIDFRAEGYPEITDWQTKGFNMLLDNYKSADFVRVSQDDAQIGDLFLIQMSVSATDHIAIYVGDDKILHHCMGRLSSIDVYGGGYWQKHTTTCLRHKSLVEI